MKKIILLFIISFIGILHSHSQTCLPNSITFSKQEQIDNFNLNYPACKEIEGSVMILGDDITNLIGLRQIVSINGTLSIGDFFTVGNPKLKTLNGLENLTYIGENLSIYHNDSLKDLTALRNLSYIDYGLWIIYNPSLKDLDGFQKIDHINVNLVVGVNDSLLSLSGLDNIKSVSTLTLESNPSLSDLTNLKNLKQVEMLRIINNERLKSLEGIDNLDTNSVEYIQLKSNKNLSKCEVKFICDYLSMDHTNYEITDNSSGCNNYDEIKSKCESLSISNSEDKYDMMLYPNPAKEILYLNYPINELEIEILSSNGKLVKVIKTVTKKINISDLHNGIYLFKIIKDSKVISAEKVIKQ